MAKAKSQKGRNSFGTVDGCEAHNRVNCARCKPAAEVLPAESAELQAVTSESASIVGFLRGLVPFFTEAGALERQAEAALVASRVLTLPTSKAEDLQVQEKIRGANAIKKNIEAHWSITSTVHQFHRRLTGARDRGAKMAEDAANAAQRLHNTYVETDRRKAAEEQDRVRREAELDAQRKRDAELAEAEAAAVKAEEKSADLSDRERRFVELVAFGLNAPETSARSAGFKDAFKSAARLMSLPKVQAAIRGLQDAQAIRQQAEAKRAAPVHADVPEVKPEVGKLAGGFDRDYHSAELLDERLLIEAIIGGKHGIPADVLTVNQAKLNEYARGLQKLIDRWPGVRYKKTTRTQ